MAELFARVDQQTTMRRPSATPLPARRASGPPSLFRVRVQGARWDELSELRDHTSHIRVAARDGMAPGDWANVRLENPAGAAIQVQGRIVIIHQGNAYIQLTGLTPALARRLRAPHEKPVAAS
jgi:hypothetical protein